MKRYGNLYHKIYDMDNVRMAHENARKGKSHYHEVRMVDADPGMYLGRIQTMLKNKIFKNSHYKVFVKKGRKDRVIHKLPYFPDRIIHHCIVQVCEPIWVPWLIPDTLACLKGRGIHKGVKCIKHALRIDPEGTRYCLKMDVKKFYPSLDHGILKRILARKIKDPDVLWLLGRIIDSTDKGVPIGNYLSQYFGNLYLTGLDHWIKESLGCRYYIRYCDDMVILGADKSKLHEIRREIETYLIDRLSLTLKSDWQVYPVAARGIDFLGYRFFPGYTLLRKSTAFEFKRKMRTIRRGKYDEKYPVSIASTIMSYHGWMRHANCLNLWHRHVDEKIKGILADVCERGGFSNPLEKRFT
ncbi:MAG: RNA-directed DNA polymerase [Deltaproteobacteria bacterium]|nr:RNA-directed DNA polymerase [Deltaproteobacteria bacterium]